MMKMVTHCGDELVIEGLRNDEYVRLCGVDVIIHLFVGIIGGEIECGSVSLKVVKQDIWVKEEENMRRMMMMKKIDGLNNEKGKRKWQSMVLEMKIEEIMCSKKEVPARV
ncbi:hypothetical protein Tco_0887740 [Tanacetum coccineum]